MVTAVMDMLDACEHHDGGCDRGAGISGWPSCRTYPSALHKDLVIERPPRTYIATPSYMALA